MIRTRLLSVLLMGCSAVLMTGCSHKYKIEFWPAERINTGLDETNGMPLEIDIVCLTATDRERPELNALLDRRAADWFADIDKGEYGGLSKHIYYLRNKQRSGSGVHKGPALTGAKYYIRPEDIPIVVDVEHDDVYSGRSEIIVFARFQKRDDDGNVMITGRAYPLGSPHWVQFKTMAFDVTRDSLIRRD